MGVLGQVDAAPTGVPACSGGAAGAIATTLCVCVFAAAAVPCCGAAARVPCDQSGPPAHCSCWLSSPKLGRWPKTSGPGAEAKNSLTCRPGARAGSWMPACMHAGQRGWVPCRSFLHVAHAG